MVSSFVSQVPTYLAAAPAYAYQLLEGATTTGGMSAEQATSLTNSLQTFGNTLLDNFIKLLPAMAVLAAIMFVIRLVRKKVK